MLPLHVISFLSSTHLKLLPPGKLSFAGIKELIIVILVAALEVKTCPILASKTCRIAVYLDLSEATNTDKFPAIGDLFRIAWVVRRSWGLIDGVRIITFDNHESITRKAGWATRIAAFKAILPFHCFFLPKESFLPIHFDLERANRRGRRRVGDRWDRSWIWIILRSRRRRRNGSRGRLVFSDAIV
jgi:hypothetical protein